MITKSKRFKKGSLQTILFSTILGILALLVVGFLVFSNWKISQRRTDLTVRIETLRKEIQTLEEKNQQLRAGISQAGTESYLEKEARERLGLQKAGEEVVGIIFSGESEEEKPEKKSLWQRILDPVRNFFGDL